jgi:hypothetical protein
MLSVVMLNIVMLNVPNNPLMLSVAGPNITALRFLIVLPARVNLIKRFWLKFTHTFCKLYHYINVTIIFLCCGRM